MRAITSCLAGLASCATTVEAPDAGGEIARYVGLAQPISFRIEADAIDFPPGADTLTLGEAVRLAVERDAALQAALARVQVALADAQQARQWPNPLLSFVLRFPEGGASPVIEAGLTADLARILARPRSVRAADQRLRATVAQSVEAALDVVVGVRTSYASVQALDELLPLLQERRALLERLVELAQARLEFGEAARVDVTTLQAQRIALDVELADLDARRRDARLELARRIAEPSSAANWNLDAWPALPALRMAEREWIAGALARRPEIQARVLELGALGDEAALAALANWDGAALGLAGERDGDWSVGPALELSIPIFDLGEARSARASAAVVAARHELVALARVVVEEVRRALADFDAVQRNLRRVQDELIPVQRRRREEIESIYLAGHVDVTALLLAEQELQATQAKAVELEERAATALIRLERAAGGPLAARDIAEGQSTPRSQP